MPDYKTMYLKLFNAVTDAHEDLRLAQRRLEEIQRMTEEFFIEQPEDEQPEEE